LYEIIEKQILTEEERLDLDDWLHL